MLDRVPIVPISGVDVPFQVLNMDCIGTIEPPSAQGHRHCGTVCVLLTIVRVGQLCMR